MKMLFVAFFITMSTSVFSFPGTVIGVGSTSCPDYLKQENSTDSIAKVHQTKNKEWILGYISAFNQFGDSKQVSTVQDVEKVLKQVKERCKTNPEYFLVVAL